MLLIKNVPKITSKFG